MSMQDVPMKPGDHPARVVKIKHWPASDRALWEANTTWSSLHFRKPYAATLAETSLDNAWKAYGRLLAVLEDHEVPIDDAIPPAVRLTEAVENLFVRALLAAGNCNNTIKQRLLGLRVAMKIMQPRVDTSWLVRPIGWGLAMVLPVQLRPRKLVGAARIYEVGLQLMREADRLNNPISRAKKLRNGLIFAICASRAPRLRSNGALMVGDHVQVHDDDFWLIFGTDDIKTHRSLEYRVPPELNPWVERYLTIERPALLQGETHKAMWVSKDGKPLGLSGIDTMFRRQTKATFGFSFGTHQCRHELASMLADAEPDNPGLAAAVLGISVEVAEQHYTHARTDLAARRVADQLASDREDTRLLADRLFGLNRIDADEREIPTLRRSRSKALKAKSVINSEPYDDPILK